MTQELTLFYYWKEMKSKKFKLQSFKIQFVRAIDNVKILQKCNLRPHFNLGCGINAIRRKARQQCQPRRKILRNLGNNRNGGQHSSLKEDGCTRQNIQCSFGGHLQNLTLSPSELLREESQRNYHLTNRLFFYFKLQKYCQ